MRNILSFIAICLLFQSGPLAAAVATATAQSEAHSLAYLPHDPSTSSGVPWICTHGTNKNGVMGRRGLIDSDYCGAYLTNPTDGTATDEQIQDYCRYAADDEIICN